MSSLLATLGLRSLPPFSPPPPNLASTLLVFNFFHAYIFMSARGIKQHYKLDHNSSPREDIQKYGEAMVKEGKLSRKQLERVKRWQSAHENCVEGYTLFVASTLLALHAGVPIPNLNGLMAVYTAGRLVYGVAYIVTETERWSWFRTLCFWSGNVTCITMMVLAGRRL